MTILDLAPGRWWRVLDPKGEIWCETSNEREARDSMRAGDTLYRLWTAKEILNEWVPDGEDFYKDATDELHFHLSRAHQHAHQAMDVCYRLENPSKRSVWFRMTLGRAQSILISLYVRDLKMERRKAR